MEMNNVTIPLPLLPSAISVYQRENADDESTAITGTVLELVEWIQDQYENAKESAKRKADKFIRKIKQMKKLNGNPVPVQKG